MKKRLSKSAIKGAFDNLPVGICFFDQNGISVLCNRQMHRLAFTMTGRDLQLCSELTEALAHIEEREGFMRDGSAVLFPDGTVWQFQQRTVTADDAYLQFIAVDSTEVYKRKKDLEISTARQAEVVAGLRSIMSNVVSITREEEILTMKMFVHDKLGWFLQRLRRYKAEADHSVNKAEIAHALTSVAGALHGEIGHDDVIDPLTELCRVASSLGVTVTITGVALANCPEKDLIQDVIRECVTNTIRHAEGDKVFVSITRENGNVTARVTNNGRQPEAEITEGGGLSSLRRQIEKAGGMMLIQSVPEYILTVTLPSESEG